MQSRLEQVSLNPLTEISIATGLATPANTPEQKIFDNRDRDADTERYQARVLGSSIGLQLAISSGNGKGDVSGDQKRNTSESISSLAPSLLPATQTVTPPNDKAPVLANNSRRSPPSEVTFMIANLRYLPNKATEHFECEINSLAFCSGKRHRVGQALGRYFNRAALIRMVQESKKHAKKGNGHVRPSSQHSSLKNLNWNNGDLYSLSLEIFTPSGALKPQHTNVDSAFGKEIEKGGIFTLWYLLVDLEYRGRGIATKLLEQAIEHCKKKKGGIEWVFVKPGTIMDDLGLEGMGKKKVERVCAEAKRRAVKFYRGFGFRRVGNSDWFCFAVDEKHVSRGWVDNDACE